jgi:hypothetical protein
VRQDLAVNEQTVMYLVHLGEVVSSCGALHAAQKGLHWKKQIV